MASKSEKYIRDIASQSDNTPCAFRGRNTPAQYQNRQHQYYARRTQKFIQARAKYSSDFVQAFVQGICPNDFYKYISTFLRFSDVVSQTATSTKNVDDVKVVLFADEKIDYFPIGAKIETMGSTWLCTNPSNISSVHGTALVQRCNAAYCLYDYYGNIVSEPIIVEKKLMSGNDNAVPQTLVLMDGYFNVTCQLNEYTRQLDQNKRLILGSKAYYITGFTDFIQEFTGDYDSVHLLQFTIRVEEPTTDDDLVNHIENGHNYTFEATISGNTELSAGSKTTLTPHFLKNGIEVIATDEHPLTWTWSSSDASIASVDENGVVTAINNGDAKITLLLKECSRVTSSIDLVVNEAQTGAYVSFIDVVPKSISQYGSAKISVGYYEAGELSDSVVEWTFSGASADSYYTEIDGNTVMIFCLKSSTLPLIVTASFGEETASAEIVLEAY